MSHQEGLQRGPEALKSKSEISSLLQPLLLYPPSANKFCGGGDNGPRSRERDGRWTTSTLLLTLALHKLCDFEQDIFLGPYLLYPANVHDLTNV